MKSPSIRFIAQLSLVFALLTPGQQILASPPSFCSMGLALLDRVLAPAPEDRIVLTTNRLTLTPLGPSDYSEIKQILLDSRVKEMSGDFSNSLPWIDILNELTFSQKRSSRLITDRNLHLFFGIYFEGNLVGTCQLGALGLNLKPIPSGVPWGLAIAYHLHPDYWGMGFATEAATRLVQFAFETVHADYVQAFALKTNAGSNNVLTKLGLSPIPSPILPAYQQYLLDRKDYQTNKIQSGSNPDNLTPRR